MMSAGILLVTELNMSEVFHHCDFVLQLLRRVQLCDPTDCSTTGLSVHHQLPEFAQTHVHQVSDVIQSSHPLLLPSPPALKFPWQ